MILMLPIQIKFMGFFIFIIDTCTRLCMKGKAELFIKLTQ